MNKTIFKQIFIVFFISFSFIIGVIWADNNGIWHRAEDVRGGIFGGDEQEDTGGYSFIDPVTFNDDIVVNGELTVDTIKSNSGGNIVIQLG